MVTARTGHIRREAIVRHLKAAQPPSTPPGADVGYRPTIAADQTDFVIAWAATANDYLGSGFVGSNGFARSFDVNAATKKNDFRVDLVPRSARVQLVGVARTATAGRFAYVWEDNRAGTNRYDVYTRVGQAFP